MTHYVYILKCISPYNECISPYNGKVFYYRGYTNNLGRRLNEHKNGRSKYTSRFKGNISLAYFEEIKASTIKEERKLAKAREIELKKMPRKKIESLIIKSNYKKYREYKKTRDKLELVNGNLLY